MIKDSNLNSLWLLTFHFVFHHHNEQLDKEVNKDLQEFVHVFFVALGAHKLGAHKRYVLQILSRRLGQVLQFHVLVH